MRIILISDFGSEGSGYKSISAPLCQGLAEKHKVWAVGLGYQGEEHPFDFSLVPARNFREVGAIVQNIQNEHAFDACIVALDIPLHEKLLQMFHGRPFKYIGVLPLESNPCIMETAMLLMQMDKVFCISQFGTDEINKRGVNAEHLVVGVDTKSWKRRTREEYSMFRERMGYHKDDFMVLYVADNQERKNISAAMEIVKELKDRSVPIKFVLITRPELSVGWKLQDYAGELGIQDCYLEIPRGMSFKELWIYYAMADVYLSTAKAEGLSMPVLEAMAVGIPVVAGDYTALSEHLSDGKGFPVGYEYTHRDPFLNGYRYWIDKIETAEMLYNIWDAGVDTIDVEKAYQYVKSKDWDTTINQIEETLKSFGDQNG